MEINAIDALLGTLEQIVNHHLGANSFVGGLAGTLISFLGSFLDDILPDINPEITYGFSGPDFNMHRNMTAWIKVRVS